MTIWRPRREELRRPVYRSLAQSLIAAVEAGLMAPGTRLPTHRALAYDLGLSVQTVSRAYDELARLGVITGAVGRGSFIAKGPVDARPPWHRPPASESIIDCSMLVPVTGAIHEQRVAAVLAGLAADLPLAALFSFRPRETLRAHCEQARAWLEGCGLTLDADRLLPTNGNTSAMTVALMTAAVPGDLVATEAMGHHTLPSLTATLGLRLAGLAMDREGVLPDAFDRLCRATSVRALYLQPAGLGATAALMGLERRRALTALARQHDVWLIENDAWGPLQAGRPPPLAALAPERTFYFTGLTKCLLPGLRIAWLAVPERMIPAARTRHLVTSWMATALMAEIASRWIADGTAAELLLWQRQQLARRNAMASRLLAGIAHEATPYGLHVWLPLPEPRSPAPWSEAAFVAHARHYRVAVAAGSSFAIGDQPRAQGIRICLGAGSEADLEEGLAVIARLATSRPEPALLAV